MSESAIVAAGERALQARRGAWWFKTHGTGHGRNGIPDLVGVYRAQAFVIEFKQPGGQPTRLQAYELERARRAGAWAIVARRRQDVEQLLDAIDEHLAGTDAQPARRVGWGNA